MTTKSNIAPRITLSRFIVFLPFVICASVGGEQIGCTPKREAAAANIAAKKAKCAAENLDRTAEQMLIDCAVPKDASDVQDLIDVFLGMQKAAVKQGAKLPNSEHTGDAGTR